MTEKLRTYKELIYEKQPIIGRWATLQEYFYDITRQEAIKHLKEIKNAKYLGDGQYKLPDGKIVSLYSWITEFFNITEKDLK